MIRPFVERLKSRKFIMAVLAGIAGFVKVYYPDFPDQALYAIVGAFMGYVAIEGAIDAVGILAKWTIEKKKPPDASRRCLGEEDNLPQV